MRTALLAIFLIACGDDSSQTNGAIGAPCDVRGTASDQCPGGSNARCFSPGLSCGPGFCSQVCDGATCPNGSACVPLTVLNQQTGMPQTIHRCFLPCQRDADCGTSGLLYCDQSYFVCTAGSFLGNLGSTGAHKTDGTACAGAPPAQTPVLGANHRASPPSEGGANEPGLATDGMGNVFTAWNGGGTAVARSSDDGVTWQALPTPDNAAYGGDPGLALDSGGRLYFSFLAFPNQLMCDPNANFPGGDEVHVVYSDDRGSSWSAPMNVAPASFVSTHFFLDKPWIATGPSGAVYVTFTPFPSQSATAPNDLWVAYSHDRGLTWSAAQMNDVARPHGRSLAMVTTDASGKVYATWWEDAGDPLAPGGFIWMARSIDRGMTWEPNVKVNPNPDAFFDDPVIATTPDGSVIYVTYQRIPPVGAIDEYDVMAAVAIGGAPFEPPVQVNDDASCATHFHAASAVDPASGDLHVIWYDNRYGDGRVMWSRARKPTTGPMTFAPNQAITDTAFPFTTTRLQFFLGDYVNLAIANGKVYTAWTDLRIDVPMPPNGQPQSAIFVAVGPLPP